MRPIHTWGAVQKRRGERKGLKALPYCSKCGRSIKYLGSTLDGDTLTDYFMCIRGHKKKLWAAYSPKMTVNMLEEAPF